MKWSWKIARISGIDVNVHATFILLVLWIGITYWIAENSILYALNGIIYILALFLCVLLHEFGHALAARKFKIDTRDITLLPIGGVARLEKMPDDPKEELIVALAGPSVNLIIGVALLAVIILTSGISILIDLTMTDGLFLGRLMVINFLLAGFNLIPAFPMDGGRVLRALLATRLEYTRATQIAANFGQGIALLFGLIGLFTNPFLIFIAFFVWIGAGQESSMVQMKSALSGIPVSSAMLREYDTLDINDRLGRAVELLLIGSQQDFPVLQDSQIVGILTRQNLLDGLDKFGKHVTVAQVMTRDYQIVDASQMLEQVSQCIMSATCRTMPVTHNDQLVGLLTMENLGEFLMIQKAISHKRHP